MPMETPSKPKLVWITGASTGIGRATAKRLAEQGCTVAVTARSKEPLDTLEQECKGLPGDIAVFDGDVTDAERMGAVVEAIEQRYGPIDLAILNAGIYLPMEVTALDLGKFRQSLDVNLMGVANGLAPLLPKMIGRKTGHLAIVSSVTGYGGLPTSLAYGATKAALINMAETLKIELDRHQVNVSVINPGFVETPATDENPFPMPFIVPADVAAQRIVAGLEKGKFEITFPKRFTYLLKAINMLPRRWYLALVKRATGWHKLPAAS